MNMGVRVKRGLVVAGLLLGMGICWLDWRGWRGCGGAGGRWRDRLLDRCPGQSPRRRRHRPLIFQGGARRASRRRQDRCRAEGALRDRPVPRRPHLPSRRQTDRHGGRSAGHQPARLRRQSPNQGRAAAAGNPIEGARLAVAPDGAGGHPAHHRDLSAQRPLRRHGRAEDHRAAEQSRRSGFRNQRRREDRHQDHHLRRQQSLFGVAPERSDQDRRNPIGSAFCRRPTSTIPTASKPTAI